MPRRAPDIAAPPPRRLPALTAAATLALAGITALVLLIFLGKISPAPEGPRAEGTVFYVVPYHYGFAFYDRDFREVEAMQVREGELVTLYIVPALALSEEAFLAYARRTQGQGIRGLEAGDPRIIEKVVEDLDLGNVEHIIGISGYPVYVTTDVASALGGRRFRVGAPGTLAEVVRARDPTIKPVTFTAKKVGAFDVICMDSGIDGAGTCGWGHASMVAGGALVVRR